jgi:hypothetical protein
MGGESKQTQAVNQTTKAPYGPAIPLVSGVAQSATNLLPSLRSSPLSNGRPSPA